MWRSRILAAIPLAVLVGWLVLPIGRATADAPAEAWAEPPAPDPNDELALHAEGQARDRDGRAFAFTLRAVQSKGTIRRAHFQLVDPARRLAISGEVTGAILERAASGAGRAEMTGTLTSGEAIRMRLEDAPDLATPDTFAFTLSSGASFAGALELGDVHIGRAPPSPPDSGTLSP